MGITFDELKEAAEMVSAAITLKGKKGAELAVETLIESRNFRKFYKSKRFRGFKRVVDEEIERLIHEFEHSAEFDKGRKLINFELKTRLSLASPISTIIAERHPDHVVVIRKLTQDRKGWKLSLRNQSGGVDVGALAKKAARGIGRGGGHPKAAGGYITDWEKFEKRMKKMLTKS